MDEVVDSVMEAIIKAGLVKIEVSARHVHLTEADFKVLFGSDAVLVKRRDLSQPGQFLSDQRVNLIGKKGNKQNVAILGPFRKDTQVELSKSDCIELGIEAPLRESGNVKDSAGIIIEGPKGTIELKEGVIIAHNHIHVPDEIAKELELEDKQHVSVQVFSKRPVTFGDVIIRVSKDFNFRMHIDFDEANAAQVGEFTLGLINKRVLATDAYICPDVEEKKALEFRIEKKIITEKYVMNAYKNKISSITIPDNALISDLAMEYARMKRMVFRRGI